MSDQVQPCGLDVHKHTAVKCNNAAWTLIEEPDLRSIEIVQLLANAATARHHWYEIGGPNETAHADLLFAWALARAGIAGASVHLAAKAISHFEMSGATWERAFAYAAMAAACSANRDTIGFQDHYLTAKQLGSELTDQDAVLFQAAFETLQEPSV